ncbi:MAG: hypothetical protein EBU84_20025, partial [Actinobacteria bacterium]|nr:hypothetical protein [Actinomycetota bacterium]
FERNTMLKTLKRKIALVAVAGLGFGLVSTVPAFAAPAVAVAAEIGFKLDDLGIAQAADQTVAGAATGAAANAVTRVGATLSVHTITNANAAPALADMQVRARITAPDTTVYVGSWIAAPADGTTAATIVVPAACGGVATCSLAVDVDLDGGTLSATTALAAGEFTSTANHLLTVRNAGAPATVAWTIANVTQLSGTAVDRALTISPKDSAGVSTILLDTETIAVDIAPVTGVATSQVGLSLAGTQNAVTSYSVPETTTVTDGVYTVTINGDGVGAGGGVTGTSIPGTTYSLFAQLLNGTAAIGAPATATYKRLSNTASLAGSVSFVDATTVTTAVTSQSAANGIATTAFKVKALDSAGGILQGATVTMSVTGVTGTFSNNSQTTGTDGITATGMQFTPATAGSGTIVATITTGTGSITASIPVTVAAYGATAATV